MSKDTLFTTAHALLQALEVSVTVSTNGEKSTNTQKVQKKFIKSNTYLATFVGYLAFNAKPGEDEYVRTYNGKTARRVKVTFLEGPAKGKNKAMLCFASQELGTSAKGNHIGTVKATTFAYYNEAGELIKYETQFSYSLSDLMSDDAFTDAFLSDAEKLEFNTLDA